MLLSVAVVRRALSCVEVLCVITQTEYEGQAKQYMDVVDPADAIITVGGDGTVSEVISFCCRCAYVISLQAAIKTKTVRSVLEEHWLLYNMLPWMYIFSSNPGLYYS